MPGTGGGRGRGKQGDLRDQERSPRLRGGPAGGVSQTRLCRSGPGWVWETGTCGRAGRDSAPAAETRLGVAWAGVRGALAGLWGPAEVRRALWGPGRWAQRMGPGAQASLLCGDRQPETRAAFQGGGEVEVEVGLSFQRGAAYSSFFISLTFTPGQLFPEQPGPAAICRAKLLKPLSSWWHRQSASKCKEGSRARGQCEPPSRRRRGLLAGDGAERGPGLRAGRKPSGSGEHSGTFPV